MAPKYPIGHEIAQAQMDRVNRERNAFHGEWNYTIKPHIKAS